VWYTYGKLKSKPFFQKRIKGLKETTSKDKFVVTLTTVLYLLYPTLCKNAFGLFDCKLIGGQYFLKIDLEEKCYEGRHLDTMLALGVGQLILYVAGLPLVVLCFLYRNRASLHKHATQARYGLFYGSYKTSRFFWETIITLRKVTVVMLSVFGPELGPEKQAIVAILLLMICIVLEIYGEPYDLETERHNILGRLEFASLSTEYWTMWSGLMIYLMDEQEQDTAGVMLTVVAIMVNVSMLLYFIVQFIIAKLYERKQARLAAAAADAAAADAAAADTGGSVEMINFDNAYENPMEGNSVKKALEKQKKETKMRKIRKRLSASAIARRRSLSRGDGGERKKDRGMHEDNIKMNEKSKRRRSFKKIENRDGGDEYYEDVETGETMWEMPKDGELLL